MKKGFLITFEGIEGSGKSTIISWLSNQLIEKGYDILMCREPGGDIAGQAIREIILDKKYQLTYESELLLMEAARSQNVANVIKPALTEGKVVLCDRFIDSTIAYQGNARGLDINLINQLNAFASNGLIPDFTILLDLPVEIGLKRTLNIDRISAETLDFHQKVKDKYLEIASNNPDRVILLDAGESLENVKAQVLDVVLRKIGEQL